MKREVGNWVDGDRFWNRQVEVASMIEHLDEGHHLLLVAQRRTGKTSLMRETARQLADRFVCLQIDLEKARDAPDAITEIAAQTRGHLKLWKRTLEVFKNALAKVKPDEVSVGDVKITLRDGLIGDWRQHGSALIDALAESDQGVVLFIDELPILVNRILNGDVHEPTAERKREAELLLSWIRDVTIRHRGKVRVVIAGSIGLEPILHQAGLSATINTFTPFELGPWSSDTAIGCLRALSDEYRLAVASGSLERMTERLGSCVPHHVQLFFSNVYEDCRRRSVLAFEVADVDRVYDDTMLSTRGHSELAHLEERLHVVLGPKRLPLARDLLTEAAVTGFVDSAGALRLAEDRKLDPAVLRGILDILEHDAYLRRTKDRFTFISNLVRDWWRARSDLHYVPLASR